MTIEQFLSTSTDRLPSASEVVSLCRELQIQFAMSDGRPVLRPDRRNRVIAQLIARLIGREPWRSQVISITELTPAPDASQQMVPPVLSVAIAPPRQQSSCKCGSTEFSDTVIHEGQSLRRECTRCHRLIGFPLWYGETREVLDA
jgi:hypothetical protein